MGAPAPAASAGEGPFARPTDSFATQATGDEVRVEASLRPRNFVEYVGQTAVVEKLKIYVKAARDRKDALDHCLFSAPPGLGRTSPADVIPAEPRRGLHVTH